MWRGISLANKCLLLFGGAVVLIVIAALTIPFLRMGTLVDEGQLDTSRQLMGVWQRLEQQGDPGTPLPGAGASTASDSGAVVDRGGIRARRLTVEQARVFTDSPFVARALAEFEADPSRSELFEASWAGINRQYRYAQAVNTPGPLATLAGMVVLERRELEASRLLLVNGLYLLGAGLFVLGLATLVFYLITHQLILEPVRGLRETAERVRQGDLAVRSSIQTGDEFEELADAFNAMLGEVARSQEQLRSINSALDTKLNELSDTNSSLFEAARLKGDFLASISHELKTPLNSIIGFTDLLRDAAAAEIEAGDDSTRLQKRIRYLDNIGTASKNLLEMITSLLDMARIEAGKIEMSVAPVSALDAAHAAVAMVAVQAENKGLELKLEAEGDYPLIETDAKKLQQILLNFLSNAVKFTPSTDDRGRPGRVTLRLERMAATASEGPASQERVRFSVLDTGPGIPKEDQVRLFSKFTQLDAGLAREHSGTGLGLAISRELAHMLQGEVQLVSEERQGSMFSLVVPVRFDRTRQAEHRLEQELRGMLADRRRASV